MDILENLNERQCEAVRATEGYVRVIAGAGSGKTKLLVSRYAYLVTDYGIDSSNILCVTFTNKAAGEMKRRIRDIIGACNDTGLICTYHGFCAKLLRENPEKVFLGKNFSIIDPSASKSMLEEIYQKYELKLDYASFESTLKRIGAVKRLGDYVGKMIEPGKTQIMQSINSQDDAIIEDYLQKQKSTYSLDFDDLINYAIYVLTTFPDVREKWQDRLNYIQVDEFQDSSRREMHLIDILSGKYQNLMIVGDPDQNIYEWRGSDVKLLVDFDSEHMNTKTVILDRNYRSTPQILNCANTLIDKNVMRVKKDLYTKTPPGQDVIHFHSKSDDDEVRTLADRILEEKKAGYSYSDMAVLYRSNFLSRVIEKKLVEAGIPYDIYGGVKFYQRMEVQDVISYLKVIAFSDDNALKRIINVPKRKFGRTKMNYLEAVWRDENSLLAPEEQKSLFDVLKVHCRDSVFKGSDIGGFVSFISEMKDSYRGMNISDTVNRVTEGTGYEKYIRELGDEERLDNLAEFKRIANEFESSFGEKFTLEDFITQLMLQSSEDRESGKDAVKLMTIHASKGLEFPVVFISGFSEGIFPSARTIEERKSSGLEEERRLCYVAITRAKQKLFLMDSEGVSQNGSPKLPSRFLNEIGTGNYVRIGEISPELESGAAAFISGQSSRYLTESVSLGVGSRVRHHAFGEGTIESVDSRRNSFSVKFDSMPFPRNISASYFNRGNEGGPSSPAAAPSALNNKDTENSVRYTAAVRSDSVHKPEVIHTGRRVPADKAPDLGTEISRLFGIGERKSSGKADIQPVTDDTADPGPDMRNVRFSDTENVTFTYTEPEGSWTLPADRQTENDAVSDDRSPVTDEFAGVSESMTDETLFYESENDGSFVPGEEEADSPSASGSVKRSIRDADNLWGRDDVPKSGWRCIGISDLGEPDAVCEMCGSQVIRYVHHMVHDSYRELGVGCVCAGKMEGNPEGARIRENEFKNYQNRKKSFMNKKWKSSRNGNWFLKYQNHLIVLLNIRNSGIWKYSVDSEFCKESYRSKEDAAMASFEAIEKQVTVKK